MESAGMLPAAADMADRPQTAQRVAQDSEERMSGQEDQNLRGWTPGRQRRALLDLLRAGKTDLEIGERFALSQWQVRNLRYRLGIKKDRGGRVRIRRDARRPATLEREFAGPGSGPAGEDGVPATALRPASAMAAEAERMGIRLAGRFDAAEAGRRLTALGGLLSASAGRFDVRVGVRQLDVFDGK